MRSVVALMITLVASLPADAAAQSLGEAAQKEKQRRERGAVGVSKTQTKVLTNDDLAKYATEALPPTTGTPSDPTSETAGAEASPPGTPTAPTSFGRTESYWRERKRDLQRAVSRSEAEVAALQRSG